MKALKEGRDLDEPELMKKVRMTRTEILKNAAEYVKELRQTGKPEDLTLAAAIEKKISEMPPVESAQEVRLRKAKEKIARKRQQRTAAEKTRAEQIKEAIRQRKAAEKKAAEEAMDKRIEEFIRQRYPTASRENIERIRDIVKKQVQEQKQQQQQEGGLSDNERTLNKEPEQKQPPKSKDLAAEREQQRSQGRGGYYR